MKKFKVKTQKALKATQPSPLEPPRKVGECPFCGASVFATREVAVRKSLVERVLLAPEFTTEPKSRFKIVLLPAFPCGHAEIIIKPLFQVPGGYVYGVPRKKA